MSALFLKYRPQTFEDIVGQTSVMKTLQNALKKKTPAHAYLFSGSRGTGKTSAARIFAKGLVCQDITDTKKQQELCDQITRGQLVDVIEIDGASNRGIDEIRELREKIMFSPNVADKKIYIIDEVHMLTTPAFNALLKTLEEPPSHAYFILATTEIEKLPDTIISRCQTFIFGRFSIDQLVERLSFICQEEKFTAEDKALHLIAKKSEGGMRDAISLLEQIAAETDGKITESSVTNSLGMATTETLENFFEALEKKNKRKGFEIIKNLTVSGSDFRTFGHDFLLFLREKMHTHITDNTKLNALLPMIEEIEKAISRLKTTPIIELPFEIAVINLTKENIANSISNKQENKITSAPDSVQKTKEISTLEEEIQIKKDEDGFTFEDTPKPTRTQQPITTQEAAPQIISNNKESLSHNHIKTKMTEISEKADIPSFRKRSFLTANPIVSGNTITFEISDDFHLQKLEESSDTKPKITQAITDIFQQKIEVNFQKTGTLAPKKSEKKEEFASPNDFSEYFQ